MVRPLYMDVPSGKRGGVNQAVMPNRRGLELAAAYWFEV